MQEFTTATAPPNPLSVDFTFIHRFGRQIGAEILTPHPETSKALQQDLCRPIFFGRNLCEYRLSLEGECWATLIISQRQKMPEDAYSLLLVEINYVKQINDTVGHVAGDHLLRCVGEYLEQDVRCCRTTSAAHREHRGGVWWRVQFGNRQMKSGNSSQGKAARAVDCPGRRSAQSGQTERPEQY
ncbi:diguanylate cyclase [Marinobacter sp. chi1]|uniref:Diguanylate cyclase n=1 Tax=Marinobacter suaedae TaxID=3057675 RepID=A0ABT8W1G6_9GAMM|nr:diguanylate cyclase [Marinobacter sp. chi1]MDO3722046.1 diguanylate cyclase [Marinobacter sp. chi1]